MRSASTSPPEAPSASAPPPTRTARIRPHRPIRLSHGLHDQADEPALQASSGRRGRPISANLVGTYWNGTDFTGPLDPFGYRMSVQAIDPDTNTNVHYDVQAYDVRTSSGVGDTDVTRFPNVVDVTVNPAGTPGDVALAAFEEANPRILDAELVNIGPCPKTHFASLRVEANAHLNASNWAQTYSDDSQGDVDGAGLTFPATWTCRSSPALARRTSTISEPRPTSTPPAIRPTVRRSSWSPTRPSVPRTSLSTGWAFLTFTSSSSSTSIASAHCRA